MSFTLPSSSSLGQRRRSLIFENRPQAGQQLGNVLKQKLLKLQQEEQLKPDQILVVSLPRGGVVIGEEIAKHLNIEHSLIFPRKIGHPLHPEVALGAVTDTGSIYWNQWALSEGFDRANIVQQIVERERLEAQRRKQTYTHRTFDYSQYSLIIVTDDALATGATMKAAISALKDAGARNIWAAVPVGPEDTVEELKDLVDDVICLSIPKNFRAASLWFNDWSEVSDEQVINIMKKYEKPQQEKQQIQGKEMGKAVADKINPKESEAASSSSAKQLQSSPISTKSHALSLAIGSNVIVEADLNLIQPLKSMIGLVIFAHGSGSSRKSTRNRYVAGELNKAGIGTLLLDLLTMEEEALDQIQGHLRFNIPFLTNRLVEATDILFQQHSELSGQCIGYFGASTGGAAAISAGIAAQEKGYTVSACVSRGGRPDMCDNSQLNQLIIPTLLIVGSRDTTVVNLNHRAFQKMNKLQAKETKQLVLVEGATHLFEEAGTLEQVATVASQWFSNWFKETARSRSAATTTKQSTDLPSKESTQAHKEEVPKAEY